MYKRQELESGLKNVAASDAALAADARWKKLLEATDKVLDGREPVEVVSKSAAQARELMPKLLAEMGNLSGVVGGKKIDVIGRQLERFELNGQRLQQDLDALAAGVGDPTTTAQRIADSADFMGQVLRGFAGEDGGLGLPKVSGAEAEQTLKSAQGLYGQLNERVREELRGGATPQAAIHAGYERAFGTILDSNVTTLIAGLALLIFGSGPVRGFAVVHCLGIMTSIFSSVVGSRVLVNLWYGSRRRLDKIAIGNTSWK